MNTSKRKCLTRRIARKGERGFTLMEILVALAIVGIIVAVTAAALGGRATTARLEAVATQVASVIQARQNLFINDLRTNDITMAEMASEMGTVFTNSTIINGDGTGAAGIVGDDAVGSTLACVSGTPGKGIAFGLEAGALSQGEAEGLQTQIQSAVDNLFPTTVPAKGGYAAIFGTTVTKTAAPKVVAATTHVYLCFGV